MASDGASTTPRAYAPNDNRNGSVKDMLLGSSQRSSETSSGLLAQFTENPLFTAGFGLAGLGAGLAIAQRGVRHAASLVKRRLLVDVEINVKDESYPWFLYWMTLHQRGQVPGGAGAVAGLGNTSHAGHQASLTARLIQRFTPRMHHLSIETERVDLPNGSVQTHFALIPGPGKHILRYKTAFLMVDRVRETKSMDITKGKPWETVTLTTLYSQRHIFEDLFREAHQLAQQATEGKTIVYHSTTSSWERFGEPRRKRDLNSVILDTGIKEQIVSDVKDFLDSSKWYYDRGIPYRRGYLLHGPPGSGKTSFIQALAGELDYNIATLNLSQRGLTDDRLNQLLSLVPKRTLVLLEDADAAFGNRRMQADADGYQGANVTFSGLLNALDGVASAEERILFLTTNYVERMDAALIRPGRVDMTVHLGDASRWQIEQFWDRFYGDLDTTGEYKHRFIGRLQELGIVEAAGQEDARHTTSTAALQGLFLYNKGDMEGAIKMASGLRPETLEKATAGSKRRASPASP